MSSPALLPDGRGPQSLTHVHLARVIEAEARNIPGRPFRILDAGCGNGYLLAYVQSFFDAHHGAGAVELHGFDVADPGVQTAGFFQQTLQDLDRSHPDIDWPSRLRLIRTGRPWPFADEQFDFVITNQVLEHVMNLDHFLSQSYRVLRAGGRCVNLFPMREVVVEGHIGAPLAHRIVSHDLRTAYLRSVAQVGLDGLGPMERQVGMSAKHFGEAGSDLVSFHTSYAFWREIGRAAQLFGFRATYRYTPELYWTKLWSLVRRDYRRGYLPERHVILEGLLFHLLKRVSSVTILLEKRNTYRSEDFAPLKGASTGATP